MPDSCTIDGVMFDVYAGLIRANDYLVASAKHAEWAALTDDEKCRLLVQATRAIDALCWIGEQCDPLQPLSFPREGQLDCCEGTEIPCPTIPDAVRNASIQIAASLIPDASSATSECGPVPDDCGKDVVRIKAGSVEIQYRPTDEVCGPLPVDAMALIGCMLDRPTAGAGGVLSFGTKCKAVLPACYSCGKDPCCCK